MAPRLLKSLIGGGGSSSNSSSSSRRQQRQPFVPRLILLAFLFINFILFQIRFSFRSAGTEQSIDGIVVDDVHNDVDGPRNETTSSLYHYSNSSIISPMLSSFNLTTVNISDKNDENSSLSMKNNDKQQHRAVSADSCDIGNHQDGTTMMKWWIGPRAGSTPQGLSEQMLNVLMEGPTKWENLPNLFETTLGHPKGRFRSFFNDHKNEERAARSWLPRLFFLALHHRFHHPAFSEFNERRGSCRKKQNDSPMNDVDGRPRNSSSSSASNIENQPPYSSGAYDQLLGLSSSSSFVIPGSLEYMCPNSKFLVMAITNQGFGAFINTSGLSLVLASLRTGRIPVFWNVPGRQKQQDWMLAPHGCPDKSLTCYFLPLSPCTLTQDDISNATRFGNKRWFRRNLALPTELDDDRVVVVDGGSVPSPFDNFDLEGELADMNRGVINATVEAAYELLLFWNKSEASVAEFPIIERAIKLMSEQSMIMFAGYQAVWAYLLRPNPKYKQILANQTFHALSSAATDSSFNHSIGFPIRGSDKCGRESTCLSIQTYMDIARDVYNNQFWENRTMSSDPPTSFPNLIVTTEDAEIFNKILQLSTNHRSVPTSILGTTDNASFPYRVLLNSNDNLQGSGNPRYFRNDGHNTVVSSLVAIILQLHANKVYGNCCSNWHTVMRRLVEAGLSSQQDASFTCLNLAPAVFNKRKYRICCAWKRDEECNEIYKEYNNHTNS